MLSTDTVGFQCTVRGGINQPLNVTWMGPAIASNLHTIDNTLLPNHDVQSTLTLSGVTYDSVGEYWCITSYNNAQCQATSSSDPATLFIVEAPTLVTEPDPPLQNVSAGSFVDYHCSFLAPENSSRLSFQQELTNFTVFWEGPSDIDNNFSYQVVNFIDEDFFNSTLSIANTSSVEGGLYTCIARNIDGMVNSSALLFVDPVIQPINYTTTVNYSLTITCDVQQFPVPSFLWQKYVAGSFQTLINSSLLVTTNENLTFELVDFDDQGEYRCGVYSTEFGLVYSNSILITGGYNWYLYIVYYVSSN